MSDYITLEEAKHSLELTGLSYKDEDLSEAISAASRCIDSYCGRTFTSGGTADVRYYTAQNPSYLEIDDVISVGTVQSDYNGDGTYETTWVQGTDYSLEPVNAAQLGIPYSQLKVLYPRTTLRLPYYTNGIKVTGQFGWSSTPPEIKRATRIIATRFMKRTDAPFGVVGMGFDNTAVRIPAVDPDIRFLLDPWVKGGGVMVA